MEFRPFSPLHMLIQLLLVVFLLGGNYLYVNWFFKKIEPGAKSATEVRLGIGIERGFSGAWTVPAKNLQDYAGSKFLLQTGVFAIQFVLLMMFVAGFLLELIFLYVLFGWLYQDGR